jgi:hypothetical protein
VDITLRSFSSRTGALTWSHDPRPEILTPASVPEKTLVSEPTSGDGSFLLSYRQMDDLDSGWNLLVAYDPATGAAVRTVYPDQVAHVSAGVGPVAVDEAGNIYAYFQNRLFGLRPNGDVRYELPPREPGELAVGRGIAIETNSAEAGGATRISRASDGMLIVSSGVKLSSPIVSGRRFGFVESERAGAYETAALEMYDLVTNAPLWHVDLAAVLSTGRIDMFNPLFTSNGLVFLVEQVTSSASAAAVRVFNGLGNEVIHCALPSQGVQGYSGANLAGGRLILWGDDPQGQHMIWGFDTYGIEPASSGWVSEMGNAGHGRRAR